MSHKLTPCPTSLFTDGAMRTQKNKAKLNNILLEGNTTSEGSDCIRVADRGALLSSCNWSKNENFRKIFQKYIDKCLMERFDVVVFWWVYFFNERRKAQVKISYNITNSRN